MRRSATVCLLVLATLVSFAPSSLAASIGIQIQVEVDGGSGFVLVGTALGGPSGGSTPLQVHVNPGNTLRFTVQLDQVANYQSYGTGIIADDPTEIDFVPGSGVDLSGIGFASFSGNPNNSLNDATPGNGFANRAGSAFVIGQNLFQLRYVVTSTPGDSLVDFKVNLSSLGSGNTVNSAKREASVALHAPELSSLSLVLSGLAGLGATRFLRRRL